MTRTGEEHSAGEGRRQDMQRLPKPALRGPARTPWRGRVGRSDPAGSVARPGRTGRHRVAPGGGGGTAVAGRYGCTCG